MAKRAVLSILGVLCILIGIVGLVIPGIQGITLIFVGLSMVAPQFAARLKGRLYRRLVRTELIYLIRWGSPAVEAAFTTRHFAAKFSKTDDLKDPENFDLFLRSFRESRAVRSHRLKPIERAVLMGQVHGSHVAALEKADEYSRPGLYPLASTDGVITCIPGLTLLAFSADCLTLFFQAGAWVGIAHAGWRGTRERISSKLLILIAQRSGLPASDILIHFGPCIGKDRYEVGEEFEGYFKGESLLRKDGKRYFDLAGENYRQLVEAGADPKKISNHEICTFTENRNFYSYRREGENSGRLISLITKT